MADLLDIALLPDHTSAFPVWHYPAPKRTPQKCPVCDGKGTIPIGFYSDIAVGGDMQEPTCRTCKGDGIVWDWN
jgi:hypothetical protein